MPKKTSKNSEPDKVLLYSFATLLVVGIVILISASISKSNADFGNIYGYFVRQLLGIGLGVVAGYMMYKIPYKYFEKWASFIFLGALGAMLLVFVPSFGVRGGGAQRWVDFGFVSFQPSEFIKIAFIIYLAAWLSAHLKEVKNSASFVPFLVLLGMLGVLLMLQPDMSTALIIAAVAASMYFIAGAKWKDVVYMGSIGIATVYLFVKIAPYRVSRVMALFNPQNDPLGASYQLNQMLIAVGAGQIWGAGPFQGTQKDLIPLVMNDAIYAAWAEETGFIGAVALVLIFLVIAWRGFSIAENSKSNFAKFTALGITTWIFIQAFVNMGAIIGVLPITGVTLPLISYGGSSMVATLMGVGLLLQISKEAT
ncbi:MAG: putative lipid II flippase FtsW [Candidatus Spechtbacterales bacterium]